MLNKLNSMMNNTESELTKEVIAILLDNIDEEWNDEEVEMYIQDVLRHGCVTGIIPQLIYTTDCDEFFTNNMDEIFELYNEKRDEGYELNFDIDKVSLSWFAFECIVDNVASELEIEW